ncbi:hypothetical protein EWH99_07975 [Sporolactobacillus sp. THM7-7]|nr:hypothetical protein EWH99_07975 [Sporolactobacillus sp. THM7-7]
MKWRDRWIKGRFELSLFQNRCSLCYRKVSGLRKYINDRDESIKVCPSCGEYAERRAFRKK